MKVLKFSSLVLLGAFLAAGCGSKNDTTTKNETKPTTPTTETKTTTPPTTTTSGVKNLYKIEKVEAPAGSKIAPNFTWTEDGKQMSLKDMKGKVLFVNFWATWCGPCKKEIPDLMSLNDEYSSKGFNVIGMNVFQNENSATIENYLKASPISYRIIDGNEDVVNAFSKADGSNIEAVPTTFVIDKEGKIVETIIGTKSKADFKKIIDKYL